MKRFQPKPYDAPRAKRTPAQDAATRRNFQIFKLRGLWSACGLLAEPYRTTARRAIDEDLFSRGVEPHGFRETRLLLADIIDELCGVILPSDIPY
jgi:hypothetical protein